jgi:DNA processing protein
VVSRAGGRRLPELPEVAWLAALAGLPGVGPARLRGLVAAWGAAGAWARLVEGAPLAHPDLEASVQGRLDGLVTSWRRAARVFDVAAFWERHQAAGVEVLRRGGPGYPAALELDPDPPEVLFAQGRLAAVEAPCVAVVGTRACTRYGHDVARRLGRDLAGSGVAVVSGLAAGIDGAAHEGALDAVAGGPPIGVVGSGLDVVYPQRHRALWQRVGEAGLLLSEAPLGTRPEPWRFPARNRLIAGLSRVVLVVESPGHGGALLTAGEAADRGVPVMAVPGPITSRASAGANRLLADGAHVACDTESVLLLAGVDPPAARAERVPPAALPGLEGDRVTTSRTDAADAVELLHVLGFEARSFAELAEQLPWSVARIAGVLADLEAEGRVARSDGWIERTEAVP